MDFFNDNFINEIRQYAKKNVVPIMQNNTAFFLRDKLKQFKPKSVLEIGTAIGYSGILILTTLSDVFLNTVELDNERHQIALNNFKKLNLHSRADAFCDDAMNHIKTLEMNNKKFDFIFLDGPKGQQYKYLPILKNLLNSGGVLFVDDVNYHENFIREDGFVPHKHRSMVNNLIKFNELIKNDKEFVKEFYDIDEGVLIAIKK